MSNKYKIRDQHGLNFMTCTVVGWVDLFTRESYRRIITDSWCHCIKHKGLQIHAYTIMSNHLHMIASSLPPNKLEDTMRDWKSYTAKQIIRYLKDKSQPESRREWLLYLFAYFAKQNKTGQDYQIWDHDSHPIALWSLDITTQKFNYIHNNAVKAGLVTSHQNWTYSSGPDYAGERDYLLVPIKDIWEWFYDEGESTPLSFD